MGFLTIVDLMASIPDVVAMDRPSNGDWLLFDAKTYPSAQFHGVYQLVDGVFFCVNVTKSHTLLLMWQVNSPLD